jgi:hypothetical protein
MNAFQFGQMMNVAMGLEARGQYKTAALFVKQSIEASPPQPAAPKLPNLSEPKTQNNLNLGKLHSMTGGPQPIHMGDHGPNWDQDIPGRPDYGDEIAYGKWLGKYRAANPQQAYLKETAQFRNRPLNEGDMNSLSALQQAYMPYQTVPVAKRPLVPPTAGLQQGLNESDAMWAGRRQDMLNNGESNDMMLEMQATPNQFDPQEGYSRRDVFYNPLQQMGKTEQYIDQTYPADSFSEPRSFGERVMQRMGHTAPERKWFNRNLNLEAVDAAMAGPFNNTWGTLQRGDYPGGQ